MISCFPRNWPVLSFLNPQFSSNIYMVFVYGNNAALILTKDNRVFALGNNTSGCLGISFSRSTHEPEEIKTLHGKNVKTFACGKGPHVLALTHEGKVYTWGDNSFYQLGNGRNSTSFEPNLIEASLKEKFVVNIACGGHHSLVLTEDGEVYGWGDNTSHQVYGQDPGYQPTPKKVKVELLKGEKIVDICCCDSSSMAVTNKGEIYSWGCKTSGQLGTGSAEVNYRPLKISALRGIVIEKIICGYAHTLALSNTGDLYAWGDNSRGQLGIGNAPCSFDPVKVKADNIGKAIDIAASCFNHISVAKGENNKTFIWGHCLGMTIALPQFTPIKCLHDAFSYYTESSAMHQPLIVYDRLMEENLSLTDHLRLAFDDPSTSDLTIRVRGNLIHVHKAVLKIRCQYFRTMFKEHWVENDQSVIESDEFSYEVYRAFLNYLYTDEIDLPVENVLELLDLSNRYLEKKLKSDCIERIKSGINVENVMSVYNMAVYYDYTELEKYCFQYCFKRMTAVITSPNFKKLDEFVVKDFVVKAAEAGAFKS